jgi:hypothetical protein
MRRLSALRAKEINKAAAAGNVGQNRTLENIIWYRYR